MTRRFIRGMPVSQVREKTNFPWVLSLAECLGRDPEQCAHGTRAKGIAIWAEDEIKRKYQVPPGDRAVVFLPNDEPGSQWRACTLCGSLRNPEGVWIILHDRRQVAE